jgi:hypothetical protein
MKREADGAWRCEALQGSHTGPIVWEAGRFEYGVISYLLLKKDPFLEESGIDVGYGDALATGGGSRA